MVRVEESSPAIGEVLKPITSVEPADETGYSILHRLASKYERRRNFMAVAGTIGSLLAPFSFTKSSEASSLQSRPIPLVGVVEPLAFNRDFAVSEQVANLAKSAGFNAMRVVVPYTEGEAGNIENDILPFCNAAGAAQEAGLKFVVTYQGYFQKPAPDGHIRMGFVPPNSFERSKLRTTLLTYENLLAGDAKPENPDPHKAYRCDALKYKVTGFAFEPFQEWNLDDPPFVADQQNAPANFVNIYKTLYPALKKHAAQLGVEMELWAGAETSAHGAAAMIQRIGAEEQRQGIKGVKIFDDWSHHPYASNSDVPPSQASVDGSRIGVSDYDYLIQLLKDNLGFNGPVVYDEFGVQSTTPHDKESLYGGEQPNVTTVDEATQAQYYRMALAIVACQKKNRGLFLFHLVDVADQDSQWRASGLYYPPQQQEAPSPDGSQTANVRTTTVFTPKSSLPAVSQAIWQARRGTLTNCSPGTK